MRSERASAPLAAASTPGGGAEAAGRFAALARIDHLQQQSVAAYPTILSLRPRSSNVNFSPDDRGFETINRLKLNLRRPVRSVKLKS
jgi:hypothetical protein